MYESTYLQNYVLLEYFRPKILTWMACQYFFPKNCVLDYDIIVEVNTYGPPLNVLDMWMKYTYALQIVITWVTEDLNRLTVEVLESCVLIYNKVLQPNNSI